MATTNFGLLTNEQKTIWSMDLWKNARNQSFINKFLGTGPNSMIQHITELKQSEKGARAVITLLADLQGDGVAGDRTLEGNEEGMQTFDQVIRVDQLRHANRHEGKMADQKSIVEFRENSKNVLAYWLADRIDQMAFLTLAGVSYAYKPGGAPRVGSDLINLEFAADVAAPSTRRRTRWDNVNKILKTSTTGNNATTDIVNTGAAASSDFPAWQTFVQLKAYAKDRYIRGVTNGGGEETYHAFMTPQAMARLKQDADYMANLRYSQSKDVNDNLFTGSTVKIDGIYLHEFRHVPSTISAVSGTNKYGAGFDKDGCQILFCGAQALGMADIKAPEWNEKGFDYENSQGISVGKILGFLKPKFGNIYEGNAVEDFGVISCYTAY
jgi:N4-gp56 family major capsid protein